MFFTSVLVVYVLMGVYVYFRFFALLKGEGKWVVGAKLLFLLLVLAFPVMHSFEDLRHGPLWDVVNLVGSFWVAAMIYLFLIVLLIDIVRLVDRFVPVIPARFKSDRRRLGRASFFGSISAVVLIIFFGWLNTLFVRVRDVPIDLAKLPKAHNPTHIVFVSDLHLGKVIGEGRLKVFVDEINAQHPDLILLGGDLVQDGVGDIGGMGGTLARLHAPLGVYAVLGNHEYHGGGAQAEAFMRSAGIVVLRDREVTIPGIVNIVGLDDRTVTKEVESEGSVVPSLVRKGDPGLPMILLAHRPINLDKYEKDGIDLMLSGHTHHGQFFPLSVVTDYVYRVSYGYAKVGPMQVYVTSGLGTWGPPVRVLTQPEIVLLTLVNKTGEK